MIVYCHRPGIARHTPLSPALSILPFQSAPHHPLPPLPSSYPFLFPGYFFFFIGSAFLFAHSTVTYHWERSAPGWLQPLINSLPFWALKVRTRLLQPTTIAAVSRVHNCMRSPRNERSLMLVHVHVHSKPSRPMELCVSQSCCSKPLITHWKSSSSMQPAVAQPFCA